MVFDSVFQQCSQLLAGHDQLQSIDHDSPPRCNDTDIVIATESTGKICDRRKRAAVAVSASSELARSHLVMVFRDRVLEALTCQHSRTTHRPPRLWHTDMCYALYRRRGHLKWPKPPFQSARHPSPPARDVRAGEQVGSAKTRYGPAKVGRRPACVGCRYRDGCHRSCARPCGIPSGTRAGFAAIRRSSGVDDVLERRRKA